MYGVGRILQYVLYMLVRQRPYGVLQDKAIQSRKTYVVYDALRTEYIVCALHRCDT